MDSAASADREPTIENTTAVGIDFADRDLRGRDFSNESLQNANFSGADLRSCSFWNCDLSDANFQTAKIGIAPEQVSSLLIKGLVAALGYVLLLGLWGELLLFLSGLCNSDPRNQSDSVPISCGAGDSEKLSNHAEKYLDDWKSLGSSEITLCFCFAIIGGVVAIAIVVLLMLGYVNTDGILEALTILGSCLAIGSGCLGVAVFQARELSKTDFSRVNLNGAKIERTAFDEAKSEQASIDGITWL
jgi:Pentapeptide repeats (9 copies)/Pentapeptide repeats (8 copies)